MTDTSFGSADAEARINARAQHLALLLRVNAGSPPHLHFQVPDTFDGTVDLVDSWGLYNLPHNTQQQLVLSNVIGQHALDNGQVYYAAYNPEQHQWSIHVLHHPEYWMNIQDHLDLPIGDALDISHEASRTALFHNGRKVHIQRPGHMKLDRAGSLTIVSQAGSTYLINPNFILLSWNLPPHLPDEVDIIRF